MNDDVIGAARRASKVTVEEAASVCGLSRVTYLQREQHPDQFRICELMGLHDCLTELGKRILVEGITNFLSSRFCLTEDLRRSAWQI